MAPSHRYNLRPRGLRQPRAVEQEQTEQGATNEDRQSDTSETAPEVNHETEAHEIGTNTEAREVVGDDSEEHEDDTDSEEHEDDTDSEEDEYDIETDDEEREARDRVHFTIESSDGLFRTGETIASRHDDMWSVAGGLIASMNLPNADDLLNDYIINVNGYEVLDGDGPPHGHGPGRTDFGSIAHWIDAEGEDSITITLYEHEKGDDENI
jgi:hypothetical protein